MKTTYSLKFVGDKNVTNKIEAIKLHRTITRCNLVDAKRFIEEVIEKGSGSFSSPDFMIKIEDSNGFKLLGYIMTLSMKSEDASLAYFKNAIKLLTLRAVRNQKLDIAKILIDTMESFIEE